MIGRDEMWCSESYFLRAIIERIGALEASRADLRTVERLLSKAALSPFLRDDATKLLSTVRDAIDNLETEIDALSEMPTGPAFGRMPSLFASRHRQ